MKVLKIIDNNKKTLTATGYGKKLHTGKKAVLFHNNNIIERDIYCCIYSNVGTQYIILNNQKYIIENDLLEYELNKPSFEINHIDTCLDCYFTVSSRPYFQIPLYYKITTYKELLVDCLLSVDWIATCLECSSSDFEYSFHAMQIAIYDCFKYANLDEVFTRLDCKPTDYEEPVNVYFEVSV